MSIIKEVGLPKLPSQQSRNDEGRDLSERVPPPRSSSPVIGSPPVRAVPIGTPPKQPMSHALNHQVSIGQWSTSTLQWFPAETLPVSLLPFVVRDPNSCLFKVKSLLPINRTPALISSSSLYYSAGIIDLQGR